MKLLRALIWILLTFSLFFPTQSTFTVQAATLCDQAQFVADVTIPDGTVLAAGTTFTKTWRLKNIGTCTWGSGYRLVFSSGAQMGGPAEVNLPYSVAPGQMVDVSVTLTAPSTPGTHRGYWMLKNASGILFGLGWNADKPFWVEIVVPSEQNVVLDFFSQAANASWGNVSGSLPFPGREGDPKGFVLPRENPTLESGVVPGKALLMVPQQVYHGVIYGVYPALTVQRGDEFQATIGCEQGATGCYARFTLQYLDSNGLLYTLWSFDEKYDGLVYSARIPLNVIAGKTVRFVLKVRAAGPATDDRAVWVNPVIVRTGGLPPTATPPVGTLTPTPTVPPGMTPTPTSPPVSGCDKAQFIADVTVPDGTLMSPGQVFDKTWRLKNIGTCTWTTAYKLVFVGGEQMGGPAEANLPRDVPPGSTVDLTVRLTAPSVAGTYRGYWQFKNASGVLFGIGTPAVKPWWVEIRVSGPTPTATPPPPAGDTLYDFVAHACEAQWVSGAGNLPCPGSEGDARGFVRLLSAPRLENGVIDSRPGLLTVPQNVYNGYIQGIYPPIQVQAGDRFESVVNCEYGATSCLVIFRLDYRIGSGPTQTLWAFGERYEGLYYRADLDLSALAGQEVRFVLTVLTNGSASGDRALWVAPRIRRPGMGAISTPTPTATIPAGTPSPTFVPSPTATTTSWTSGLDVSHLTYLRLFDRENGWAITTGAVYRRQGASWQNVTPPSFSAAGRSLRYFFLDLQNAWLLPPPSASQGTLYHTADGGQNWETISAPFGLADLVFLSANEGWALAYLAAGAGSSSIAVYRTADGGHSWELRFVNDPNVPSARQDIPLSGIKNGLAARDFQVAWVTGTVYSPLTPYLYVSHDGGQSWQLQNISLPPADSNAQLTFRPPIFLNTQQALLLVEIAGSSSRTAIYVSRDGGESWELAPNLLSGVGRFQSLSLQEWFFWNGTAFLYTSDGGQSWETRTPDRNFGDASVGWQFLNSQEGFLWTVPIEGLSSLYHTLDGGRTWVLLNP